MFFICEKKNMSDNFSGLLSYGTFEIVCPSEKSQSYFTAILFFMQIIFRRIICIVALLLKDWASIFKYIHINIYSLHDFRQTIYYFD